MIASITTWSHLPSLLPWSPKQTQRPTRFPSPHSITPRLLRYLWWDNTSAVICIKEDGIDDVHTRHNMKDNGYPCHEHQLLHHLVTAGASLGHLTSSALSSAVSAAITGPWIVKFVQFRYIYIWAKIPSVTDASAPRFHQSSPNYKYQQLLSFMAV